MDKKTVLVVGLGMTGCSIARYLNEHAIPFEVFDTRKAPAGLDAFKSLYPSVPVYLEDYPREKLQALDKIICSPGVPLDIPVLAAARAQHILIESDIDVFARAVTAPIIAVTGTNGKSTVTTLLGEMGEVSGLHTKVAGNIGKPVLDILLETKARPVDLFVLELSSFQLEMTHELAAEVAIFLNLSDDHLDRHHDMASYARAKQRIYRGAKNIVFNRDDSYTLPDKRILDAKPNCLSFSKSKPEQAQQFGMFRDEATNRVWLCKGDERLLAADELGQKGIHNAENALAALAATDAIGLARAPCLQVLKTFKGLPHRCQVIRTFGDVTWINDSKGTNVGSTQAALEGLGPLMKGRLILIAGGQGKGADFTALQSAVKNYVSHLVLIGEDAPLLEQALNGFATISHAGSMEEAVRCANAHAKPHDTVLLSPACASFDWFNNFNHRGEVFIRLVEAL